MFDNIVFDEFTLLEGEQAEEYKEKKAKEAAKREREEEKHFKDRTIRKVANKMSQGGGKSEEDMEDDVLKNTGRAMASSKTARKHFGNVTKADSYANEKDIPEKVKKDAMKSSKALFAANDAIDRHDRKMARRKAKNETALALIEAYEPEFIY